MNFRSWQRWQLIEYALLQKISEEKAVENGKSLPQTKQDTFVASNTPSIISMLSQTFRCYVLHHFFDPCYFKEIPLALTSFIPALL